MRKHDQAPREEAFSIDRPSEPIEHIAGLRRRTPFLDGTGLIKICRL